MVKHEEPHENPRTKRLIKWWNEHTSEEIMAASGLRITKAGIPCTLHVAPRMSVLAAELCCRHCGERERER